MGEEPEFRMSVSEMATTWPRSGLKFMDFCHMVYGETVKLWGKGLGIWEGLDGALVPFFAHPCNYSLLGKVNSMNR